MMRVVVMVPVHLIICDPVIRLALTLRTITSPGLLLEFLLCTPTTISVHYLAFCGMKFSP